MAAFFEQFLGFKILSMGTSRVVKKDQLEIVLEDARDRDVVWPGNFHIGIEVATRADLARIHADMCEPGDQAASMR
jgi:catechol-2,3-dioxygenase